MHNDDPKGYYSALGVSPTASADEIKNAYRLKAKETYPDKNIGRNTTSAFQFIAEAYAVLSDPRKRAEYEASAREIPSDGGTKHTDAVADPIRCASCHAISAQPRYAILFQVVSYLVATHKTPVQGVFCPRCALKKALKASAITWVAGWWGFPWGLVYSIEALWRNLLGGIRPPDVNAKILAYQAWWFAMRGHTEIARSVAVEALKLATSANDHSLMGTLGEFLNHTNNGRPIAELKSQWSTFNKSFAAQAILALAVVGSIYGWTEFESASERHEWEIATAQRAAQRATPPQFKFLDTAPQKTPPLTTAIPGPKIHPEPLPDNGEYTSYWKGSPRLAPFRVTAPAGNVHYYIKLADSHSDKLLITIFIRAGQTVNVEVPLGSYRMKYAAGYLWYGEDALFGPQTQYSEARQNLDFLVRGNQIVGHTIELILRPDGNLQTSSIRPSEF